MSYKDYLRFMRRMYRLKAFAESVGSVMAAAGFLGAMFIAMAADSMEIKSFGMAIVPTIVVMALGLVLIRFGETRRHSR